MFKTIVLASIIASTFIFTSCLKESATPLNLTGSVDTTKILTGKWFWYKTLIHDTSSGQTGVDTFYNDYSIYDFRSNHLVYTSAYYKFNNSTVNDSMHYFISKGKLGTVRFTSPNDTSWFTITNLDSNYFSIYIKNIYTSTNPPTAVEYWQYFAK